MDIKDIHGSAYPGVVEFTPEERAAQLAELESLCDRMADAFVANDDLWAAEAFRVKAQNSRVLQAEGFTQTDLNELGGELPDRTCWLNPRAEAILKPWQEEILALHQRAQDVARDLRIGRLPTVDRRPPIG